MQLKLLSVNAIHMLIGKKGISIKKILEKIKDICLSKNSFLFLAKKSINSKLLRKFLNHKYDGENQMLKHFYKDLINEKNEFIY